MLVAARFIQGVGGAMASACVLGMIVMMFPEPREQAKAIGVFAFVASAGGSVGLVAGGVLTQSINWHWIFFINLPIGIATAFLALRYVTRDKGIGFADGTDVPGAVLITSSLMLGVYTIVKPAAEKGWGDSETLGLGVVALVLLAAFIVREARAANPLVPLRIFRSRNLTGSNLVQIFSVAGMFGMFFLGSLYLQRVLGYSALEIGLAFLPVTLVMGTMSIRYSEKLIMHFGAYRLMLPGLGMMALGLLLFTRAPVDGSYVEHVLPVMVLLGLGAGTCFPGMMTLAMSGVGNEDAGLASGLLNTAAQAGGALGLAVLATVSASRSDDLLASGTAQAQALTSGYHLAFVIGAALIVAAMVVVAAVMHPPATPAPAEHEQHGPAQEPAYAEA
jgi:MFS family permease